MTALSVSNSNPLMPDPLSLPEYVDGKPAAH